MTTLLILLQLAFVAPDRSLEAANALFDAGDYAGARARYHDILDAGQGSAALYYNLGTTYVRLDSLPRAVQYFEKADALAPGDEGVAHNLALVRARLGLDAPAQVVPPWQQAWSNLRRAVSPLALWWMGFALFLLAALLAAWRIWSRPRSAWLRRGVAVAGALGVMVLAIAYALSADVGAQHRAVVLENVVARDAEGASARLHAGEVVVLASTRAGVASVVLPDGGTGEVPVELLGTI